MTDMVTFLVLHLITSLWGLEQVLNVIDDEKISRDALKCYYAAMVGLLSASASGIPSVEAIDDVLATFGSSFDSNDRIQDSGRNRVASCCGSSYCGRGRA